MSELPRAEATGGSFHLGRRAELDGLRGVAVALVVWHHLRILIPGHVGGPDAGYFGVDVFFVLSGFLITSLLVDEHARTGAVSLRGFWRRRVLRLVPAVSVFLAVYLVVSAILGDPLTERVGYVVAALTSTFNWVVVAQGADHVGVIAPLWSLSIEEQFYVLWPLAVAWCLALAHGGRERLLRLTVAGAIALGGWRAVVVAWRGVDRAYFHTDARVDALLVGAALALALHRWGRPVGAAARAVRVGGWLAAAVLAWLVAATDLTDRTLIVVSPVVAISTAVVVVALLDPAWRVSAVLRAGPLRWIGTRSYALYLWHTLVIVLVSWGLPGVGRPVLVALSVLASLAVADASWRWVEAPFRRLRVGVEPPSASADVGAHHGARTRSFPVAPVRRALTAGAAAALAFVVGAVAPALAARAGRTEVVAEAQRRAIASAAGTDAAADLAGGVDGAAELVPGAGGAAADPGGAPGAPDATGRPGGGDAPAPLVVALSLEQPEVRVASGAGLTRLDLRARATAGSSPTPGVVVDLSVEGVACTATTDSAGFAVCGVEVASSQLATASTVAVVGVVRSGAAPALVEATFPVSAGAGAPLAPDVVDAGSAAGSVG